MSFWQAIVSILWILVTVAQVHGQNISKVADCGSTHGCFSDCRNSTCTFIVSWNTNGSNAVYSLSSIVAPNPGAWIAVAFSNDNIMENDDVQGCATGGNGAIVVFSARTPRHSMPTLYNDTEVVLSTSRIENGVLSCTFQRPIAGSTNRRVNVSSSWILLFAHGSATINATGQADINYHGSGNRHVSPSQATVNNYTDISINDPTQATTTSPKPQSGTVTKVAGCGTTVGCFSDCQGETCSFAVSWIPRGNNAIYTLSSNVIQSSGAWIAIAFSNDSSMGNDDALGCASDPSGAFVAFSALTPAHSKPTLYYSTEVVLSTSNIENGVLSCTIQRPIGGSSTGRVNVSDPWTLFFAKGAASINTAREADIDYHEANTYISPVKVTVNIPIDAGAPQITPAGKVSKPTGCASTVGCFLDCQGSLCDFAVYWYTNGTNAVYTLSFSASPSSGAWIAVAFSTDSIMGSDDVLGCASDVNGTQIVPFSAKTPLHAQPIMYSDLNVTLLSQKREDGILTCVLQKPIAESSDGRVDANSLWTLLFASGIATISASNQPTIMYHGNINRYVSGRQVRASDMIEISSSKLEYPLVKAHGSLMIVAWIFFASIGIVLARYYKPAWTGLLCSEKVWFQLHRICMILVFLTTAAGFIIIFIEVKGYSTILDDRRFLIGHPIIGIIVMILTIMNPVMAIFRCHPGTSKRPIFNWAHWFVGTSAHILGVVNIFFGVLLGKADVPYYLVYILGAYVAWQIFVELLLEAITCFGRRIERSEAYELSSGDSQKQLTTQESSGAILAKQVILFVHCIIVAAFSAVLIGLLATGKTKREGN